MYGSYEMNLSEKEIRVLRELLKDSDRSQKEMSASSDLSQADFTKTKQNLIAKGIIKKFTVDLDYKKLGFPNTALFLFAVEDKKSLNDIIADLSKVPEIIEITEVFGEEHDVIVRLMCEDNEKIRMICKSITELSTVKGGESTYTIIHSATYKLERGVKI